MRTTGGLAEIFGSSYITLAIPGKEGDVFTGGAALAGVVYASASSNGRFRMAPFDNSPMNTGGANSGGAFTSTDMFCAAAFTGA